jgi:16S rRNA A1518/A1519 N6-dimethyltransferase RsmA/KsgA/DIM1 with predicted DNA glycosylase/AP lyase activity
MEGGFRLFTRLLDADILALMGTEPWNAVGNLPYYATTPIVLRLLSLAPESMTLMVQKERLIAFLPNRKAASMGRFRGHCLPLSRKGGVKRARSFFKPHRRWTPLLFAWRETTRQLQIPRTFCHFEAGVSMRRKTLYNVLSKDSRVPAALEMLGFSAIYAPRHCRQKRCFVLRDAWR